MNENQKKDGCETEVKNIFHSTSRKLVKIKAIVKKMNLWFRNDFPKLQPTYIFIESKCNFCAGS